MTKPRRLKLSKSVKKETIPHISFFCRVVGPGGTSVDLIPTPEKIKAIFTNETTPSCFECSDEAKLYKTCPHIDPITEEHKAGDNVASITWKAFHELYLYAKSQGYIKDESESATKRP